MAVVTDQILDNAINLTISIKPITTLNQKTMKRIIYILLIAFTSSMSFTACTEEEVTPQTDLSGGGHGSDPR